MLGTLRETGLDRLLPRWPERLATLALALIVARVVEPAAKLATARQLSEATASHSLGAVLRLGEVDEDELYRALDLLGAAQPAIGRALARRHLKDGTLVLYDVTSSYLEGRCCELARFGYSRDGRPDRPQIVFGLLCAADGCPVAVEVFEGDTADPQTLAVQIDKLKRRFGLKRVVLVGDRGTITSARIEEELKPAGLDWITALRAPAIQALADEGGPLQLSLFDDRDIGAVLGRREVAEHFRLTITDTAFAFMRDEAAIAREAALDGFYVLRTSVSPETLDAATTVLAYKSLAQVERAFRSLESIDLDIRPVHHRLAGRVRAHVFLCMLAYYVQWRMRRKPAPLLFEDHDRPAAAAARPSPVAAAEVSPAAHAKARTRKTDDGAPVHSFRTLLADLATLTRNTVRFGDKLPMTVLSCLG